MPSSADSGGDREDGEYEDDASLAEFLESEVLGDEDETSETLNDEKSDVGSLALPGVETDSDAAQVGRKIGQVCMHVVELFLVCLSVLVVCGLLFTLIMSLCDGIHISQHFVA